MLFWDVAYFRQGGLLLTAVYNTFVIAVYLKDVKAMNIIYFSKFSGSSCMTVIKFK
jgi:hypothetical protein